MTFSNLEPDLGGSAIAFDTFLASRQVRIGNDHLFTSGFAATLHEHADLGTVLYRRHPIRRPLRSQSLKRPADRTPAAQRLRSTQVAHDPAGFQG